MSYLWRMDYTDMLSKIIGSKSSTLLNLHMQSLPIRRVFMDIPDFDWYCAITCLQAPQGVTGDLHNSPFCEAAIASAVIARSGLLEPA